MAEVDYEKFRSIIKEENETQWKLIEATFVKVKDYTKFKIGTIVAIVALGGGAGALKFTGIL